MDRCPTDELSVKDHQIKVGNLTFCIRGDGSNNGPSQQPSHLS